MKGTFITFLVVFVKEKSGSTEEKRCILKEQQIREPLTILLSKNGTRNEVSLF